MKIHYNPKNIILRILIIGGIIFLGSYSATALDYMEATAGGLDTLIWEGGQSELEFYDINLDGNPDILSIGDHGSPFINTQEHGVMVYFGNGFGGFNLLQNGNFGYGGIAVGDINNDGFPDIGYGMHHNYSTTDFGDQLIEAALGNGLGTSWEPWDDFLATQGETYGMFATDFGDVDNDGDLDIGCTSFGFGNPLQIYRNQMDGHWDFVQSLSTGNCDMLVQFGDINIDGKLDIITAYQNTTAWFGTGTGYFINANYNLPNGPLSGLSGGDVDNDGGMDLAYFDGGAHVKIWNDVSHLWEESSAGLPAAGSGYTQLYDMNSDGFCDLVTGNSGQVHVYLGNGGNGWTLGASYTISDPDAPFEFLRSGCDVDHNGYADIVHLTDEGSIWTSANHIRLYKESSIGDSLWIKPIFPKGNETLLSGSVRFLEWAAEVPRGVTGTVTLEYSLSGAGGPWTVIAANAPNSGRYQWITAPFSNSSNARIRYMITTPGGSAEAISGQIRIYQPEELLEFNLTPLGTPIVIPPGGGTFSFTLQALAPMDINAGFDLWTAVILPNGTTYGPLLVRKGLLLAGGSMMQRTLTQSVPGTAPSGIYTYYAYAGVYDNGEAWYDEFFTFEKTAGDEGNRVMNWSLSGWGDGDFIVSETARIPEEFSLLQNFPNPFNSSTTISYYLPEPGEVKVIVYNSSGRQVWSEQKYCNSGINAVDWNAESIASGIYLGAIEWQGRTQVQKMVLLK